MKDYESQVWAGIFPDVGTAPNKRPCWNPLQHIILTYLKSVNSHICPEHQKLMQLKSLTLQHHRGQKELQLRCILVARRTSPCAAAEPLFKLLLWVLQDVQPVERLKHPLSVFLTSGKLFLPVFDPLVTEIQTWSPHSNKVSVHISHQQSASWL